MNQTKQRAKQFIKTNIDNQEVMEILQILLDIFSKSFEQENAEILSEISKNNFVFKCVLEFQKQSVKSQQ